MTPTSLGRVFAPQTVAVVGASPTAGKAGNALMRSLSGFGGTVHPVHPTAGEVLGRRAHPSVSAIPEQVDLALLAVPARAVPDAVGDCGAAGVAGVVVHAGGFGESGPAGAALEQAALDAARATGTRLLGPNTSGFVAPPLGLCASFVSSTTTLEPGPLAIVAQSGGVNHALAFGAQAEGLGVRLAIGLGNAADVGFSDVLEQLVHEEGVGVVALAIEGVPEGEGRRLCAAVERLSARVPLVALVLGRSDVADFARSHTGALTGSRTVARAALRQAGAVVVDDTTALLDAARTLALRRLPPKARPGVGVVTGQAGPGLLLADALAVEQMVVPPLGESVGRRLRELLGELTYLRNPVDTGRPGASFPEVVRTVADAPEIDVLALYLLHEPDAVDARAALSDPALGPLVLGTAGPAGDVAALRDDLAEAGVAVLAAPERAATAVAALVRDAQAAARRADRAGAVVEAPRLPGGAGGPWDEVRAKELVERLGIATPARVVCTTHAQALAARDALGGGPVALKLLHPSILHKTELGAVRLGLRDDRELLAALTALDEIALPSPGRYLVEAMAPDGPELLLGAVRDPSFGVVVTLAAGGVAAEATADVATRIAPLDVAEASTMLDELAAAELLRGHRGMPAVDERQLAQAIARLGAVLHAHGEIRELEINPLRVTADGLVALDALAVTC